MNPDPLREYLEFYRDLGVTEIYGVRAPSPAAGPPAGLERDGLVLPTLQPTGDTLAQIQADIGDDCRRCRLCEARSKIVFGSGSEQARVVFVGEGPGADEDAQGFP